MHELCRKMGKQKGHVPFVLPCIRHSQAHATTKHETCPITDTHIPPTVVAFQNCEFRYTTVRYNGFSVFSVQNIVFRPPCLSGLNQDDMQIYHRNPEKANRKTALAPPPRGLRENTKNLLGKTTLVFSFIRSENGNPPRVSLGKPKKTDFLRFQGKKRGKKDQWDL